MAVNKGFTLVELLGVIILLGLVGLIVIPSITKLIKDSRENLYNNQVLTIEESARKWGIENTDLLSKTSSTYINLSDLINDGYIEQDALKDPRTSEDMNGCIVISYNATKAKYKYLYDDRECIEVDDSNNMTSTDSQYVCYTFDSNTGTILRYNVDNTNCLSNVIMPDKIDGVVVKHIGNAAFINEGGQACYSDPSAGEADEVSVSDSYVRHDGDGYYGCYFSYGPATWSVSITSVTFPKYLETIGTSAFAANAITQLDFSNSPNLIKINDDAFYNNPIETVDFANATKLESIGAWAISETSLINLDLSPLTNLKTISTFAFAWSNIRSVDLQGLTNLTNIEYGAFEENQITSIIIPASVTYIGDNAFDQTDGIWEDVTILYNATNPESRFYARWYDIGWDICYGPC